MDYPVLEIDWYRNKELADNIWHAQMAGFPTVLTYCGPALGVQNRRDAMHFDLDGIKQEVLHILSRDEYPFACTLEGGAPAGLAIYRRNKTLPRVDSSQLYIRAEGIQPCGSRSVKNAEKSKFVVRVINHPNGPVISSRAARLTRT